MSATTDLAHPQELYCPECGYNLREIASERCPECGGRVDRSTLGQSVVPWLQRERLGRLTAFWRTVGMATFRTRFLALEMSRPARFDEAVKFRRLVVLHAWAPCALLMLGLFIAMFAQAGTGDLFSSRDLLGSSLQLGGVLFGWLCIWLFLMAVSAVASYAFHPGSLEIVRQNRAVALSYYACAPMAYTPLTIALGVGATFLLVLLERGRPPLPVLGLVYLVGFAPLPIQILATISTSVRLLGAATHCGRPRQATLAVFLPLAWTLLAALLLVVAPLAYVLLCLMIVSLNQ
jgi:hypothetical protein